MQQEGVMMQEGNVQMQQAPPQQYPQAPPAQPSSWSLSWESGKQMKIAKVGLILMIVGVILSRVIFSATAFNLPNELVNIVNIVGIVLFLVGLLLLVLPLLMIAMHDKDLHHNVRVAIVIAVGLIIAFGF